MGHNPSLGSVDSEYDMGSMHSDLSLLEDGPSLNEVVLANTPVTRLTPPFISARPANPTMQALSTQRRETHNRSPISFREGRRASDTSLTQGEGHKIYLINKWYYKNLITSMDKCNRIKIQMK